MGQWKLEGDRAEGDEEREVDVGVEVQQIYV